MKIFLDLRGVPNAEKVERETSEFIDGYLTDTGAGFGLHVHDDKLVKEETEMGLRVTVTSPEEMDRVMGLTPPSTCKYILIETDSWKIIPLENVIARFQSMGVELMAPAASIEDLQTLAEVLEVGVDIAVVPLDLLNDNTKYFEEKKYLETIELEELKVVSVETTGSGDRVCVDTAAVLQPGEGLLLGSTSSVFVLVEAEVKESGFVNSRPFRVNAGPVSSYVLNSGRTNYLSELQAGSYVMVVSREGRTRRELVGRVKIERRPFVLVKVEHGGEEYPVLLQNAETVRLVTPEGSLSVTELKGGETILGAIRKAGRHFGISVDEYIVER